MRHILAATLIALMGTAAHAQEVIPHTLTAADAAAVNAYLPQDYLPRHVSAGDVFGLMQMPGATSIDVPVRAPIVGGKPGDYWLMEILVPVPK